MSSDSRGGISVEQASPKPAHNLQLLGESFVKAAHIVLSSRIVEPTAPNKQPKRNTWFKLELKETVESAQPALERWRSERGLGLPLVLEIRLQPSESSTNTTTSTTHSISVDQDESQGTLLERWVVHYSPLTTLSSAVLTPSQISRLSQEGIYKRLVLMLRSLYTLCRTLPAYRLYRVYKQQGSRALFRLTYKLHSTLTSPAGAAATSSSAASSPASNMQRIDFAPVDTAEGMLCVSVEHHPASAVRILGHAAARLSRPSIITNYVGSNRGGSSKVEHTTHHLYTAPSAPPAVLESGSEEKKITMTSLSAADAVDDAAATPRRRAWSSTGMRFSPGHSPSSLQQNAEFLNNSPIQVMIQTASSLPPERNLSESLPRNTSIAGRKNRPPLPPLPTGGVAAASSSSRATPNETSLHMSQTEYQESRITHAATALAVNDEDEETMDDGDIDDDDQRPSSGGGSAGGRKASAPVAIPSAPGSHHHYQYRQKYHKHRLVGLRSSGDLGALNSTAAGGAAAQGGGGHGGGERPLSAPAVSHILLQRSAIDDKKLDIYNEASLEPENAAGDAAGEGFTNLPTTTTAAIEAAPPWLHQVATDTATPVAAAALPDLVIDASSYSDSATSSSAAFPASCSPDLPFAFTPQARYSNSYHHPYQSTSLGGGGGGGGGSFRTHRWDPHQRPSPTPSSSQAASSVPVSPRDLLATSAASSTQASGISTSTALVHKPSWGVRSSGTPSVVEGSLPGFGGIGYSVSPLRDPVLLQSMMTSASSASLPRTGNSMMLMMTKTADSYNRVPCTTTHRVVPMLTFPANAGSGAVVVPSQGPHDDPLGALPFALAAQEIGETSNLAVDYGGNDETHHTAHPPLQQHTALAASMSAPAVGAFVRQMREARPLQTAQPLPLSAGLERLQRLSDSLHNRGFQ